MRLTVLQMLSTTSLQAFSGASTTGPVNRAGAPEAVRLVRAQGQGTEKPTGERAGPLPDTRPITPLPRGSLLNLSV